MACTQNKRIDLTISKLRAKFRATPFTSLNAATCFPLPVGFQGNAGIVARTNAILWLLRSGWGLNAHDSESSMVRLHLSTEGLSRPTYRQRARGASLICLRALRVLIFLKKWRKWGRRVAHASKQTVWVSGGPTKIPPAHTARIQNLFSIRFI